MTATLASRAGGGSPVGWAVRRAPRSAPERRALLDALEDPGRWAQAAAGLLADLGFRLIEPDRVAGDDSHLLVALRGLPTLRHFDPESVTYYARTRSGTAPTTLDRWTITRSGTRVTTPALWGHVHVLDRVPVENRFLTFGGDVRVAAIDPSLTVVDLWSPAPIVRWGGHSQGTDSLRGADRGVLRQAHRPGRLRPRGRRADRRHAAGGALSGVPRGRLHADQARCPARRDRHGAGRLARRRVDTRASRRRRDRRGT